MRLHWLITVTRLHQLISYETAPADYSFETPPAAYSYRTPPEEHAEWCNPYIYVPDVYDWCLSYVYITPPAYLAAWFYGTPTGPMYRRALLFEFPNGSFQGHQSIITPTAL